MLHSMYYRGIFAEPEVKAVRKKLERCCYHLSECSLWRELAWLHPDEIMVVDSLESVVVDGVPLYAAPARSAMSKTVSALPARRCRA